MNEFVAAASLPARCSWVALSSHRDDRGALVAIEGEADAPFSIRRVYFLHGTAPDAERGFHAHRELTQLAVCVAGSCLMLLDDGEIRSIVRLHGADRGLVIGSMVWREMREFSDDCVLLVLASEHYAEADYIRDHARFLEAVTESRQ